MGVLICTPMSISALSTWTRCGSSLGETTRKMQWMSDRLSSSFKEDCSTCKNADEPRGHCAKWGLCRGTHMGSYSCLQSKPSDHSTAEERLVTKAQGKGDRASWTILGPLTNYPALGNPERAEMPLFSSGCWEVWVWGAHTSKAIHTACSHAWGCRGVAFTYTIHTTFFIIRSNPSLDPTLRTWSLLTDPASPCCCPREWVANTGALADTQTTTQGDTVTGKAPVIDKLILNI